MSIDKAVNRPVSDLRKEKVYTVTGFAGNIRQIAERFGIKYSTLRVRLQKGIPIEGAVNPPMKPRRK